MVDLPEPGHAATQSDAFCGESTTESWKRSRRMLIVQTRGGRKTEPEAKRSAGEHLAHDSADSELARLAARRNRV